MLTGWLADQRVLEPGREGVVPGEEVHYGAGTALGGSTPAFGPGLLLFNSVRRSETEIGSIDVSSIYMSGYDVEMSFSPLASKISTSHPDI
jgi:hypothetical protein